MYIKSLEDYKKLGFQNSLEVVENKKKDFKVFDFLGTIMSITHTTTKRIQYLHKSLQRKYNSETKISIFNIGVFVPLLHLHARNFYREKKDFHLGVLEVVEYMRY